MLDPAAVARLLASLSSRERAALALVQQHGGSIKAPVLEREFGGLRNHADYPNPRAYLLALEQPPTPAERLWMLGLLIATRDDPPHASVSRVHEYMVPADLLPLLPPVPERERELHLSPAADPEQISAGELDFLERNLLILLSLGQDDLLEVIPSGGMNKASLARIAKQWDPKDKFQGAWREEHWPYMQFVRRVGEGAGLLRVGADSKLRPTREALDWLKQPSLERARRLLEGWVASSWDELSSFAGIKVQRAYFRDLPLAKRAILRLLGQVSAGTWIALDQFVAEVKRVEPDFARPDGRYDTWGLLSYTRQPLNGFEFWDQVEGRQLADIAGGTLRWLGLTDLGVQGEKAVSFRLNVRGAALIAGAAPPPEPSTEPLVVQPNFEVVAPAFASPYARFQLGRIAERIGDAREPAGVYRLTKRSVQAALERGITFDDMLRFLNDQSEHEPPQNVLASLREWAGQHGQLTMRRAVLLEADDPALLEQVRRDKRVRMPKVESLTETAWLVREGDASELAERLRKAGFGLAGDGDSPQAPLREHDLTVLFAALDFYGRACAELGIDGDVSGAMHQRVARLLADRSLNRAYQASHEALRKLKERLGEK
ncbi:MAG TPA: helicase-associated domain-containing protein [Roseiflexaceae bacterium]|nr:helicase-associated domain-containing protein [Roseiflexaceae bacterium]